MLKHNTNYSRFPSRKDALEHYSRYQTVEGYWLHYVPDSEIDKTIHEILKRNHKIQDKMWRLTSLLEDLNPKKSILTKILKLEEDITELGILNNFAVSAFHKSEVIKRKKTT